MELDLVTLQIIGIFIILILLIVFKVIYKSIKIGILIWGGLFGIVICIIVAPLTLLVLIRNGFTDYFKLILPFLG
jgi:hypothetical protein